MELHSALQNQNSKSNIEEIWKCINITVRPYVGCVLELVRL